jgi:hypothetical protein
MLEKEIAGVTDQSNLDEIPYRACAKAARKLRGQTVPMCY